MFSQEIAKRDNKVIKTYGEYKRDSIDHLEIASDIDTESAVKLAGARFAVLKNDIAKLHRALISFMLDVAEKNGYEERYVPYHCKFSKPYRNRSTSKI